MGGLPPFGNVYTMLVFRLQHQNSGQSVFADHPHDHDYPPPTPHTSFGSVDRHGRLRCLRPPHQTSLRTWNLVCSMTVSLTRMPHTFAHSDTLAHIKTYTRIHTYPHTHTRTHTHVSSPLVSFIGRVFSSDSRPGPERCLSGSRVRSQRTALSTRY